MRVEKASLVTLIIPSFCKVNLLLPSRSRSPFPTSTSNLLRLPTFTAFDHLPLLDRLLPADPSTPDRSDVRPLERLLLDLFTLLLRRVLEAERKQGRNRSGSATAQSPRGGNRGRKKGNERSHPLWHLAPGLTHDVGDPRKERRTREPDDSHLESAGKRADVHFEVRGVFVGEEGDGLSRPASTTSSTWKRNDIHQLSLLRRFEQKEQTTHQSDERSSARSSGNHSSRPG
jgi:hypothetical protein